MIEVHPELERRLLNWARWRSGGLSVRAGMAYGALAGVLRRGGPEITPVPVVAAEAEQTDRAVKALDLALQRALIEWWCQGGTLKQKAKRCRCRPAELYTRLDIAHRAIRTTFS